MECGYPGGSEVAPSVSEGRPGCHAGLRLQQDPRRNSGSARDQYRNVEGQPQSRQGAGRDLVRNHRADERRIRQGQSRARSDGKIVGDQPCRFRDPAQDHLHVLHAEGRRRLHDRRRAAQDHGSGPRLLLRAQPARRKGEVKGRGRHHDPDQDSRLRQEHQAAVRCLLHETRRRRQTVTSGLAGLAGAFSSELETASRQENASNQESRVPLRFYRNGAPGPAKEDRAIRRVMNIAPARGSRILLAAIPFFLIVMVYIAGSAERRAANPEDKLLPPISEMADTTKRLAMEPDRRSGDYVLWTDTSASLQRLLLGLGISTLIGLGFGLTVGLLPIAGASFGTIVAVISMIPPMAVLPILFIVFGLGELSKVMLIIIGVAPCLIRDMSIEVQNLPREQMIKAQTLGASTWQVAIRVVLPQIMPRLIKSVRLMLGPAFLFLISAEAIAADVGLGYRIFLVRRYLSMDVILPYVAWITLLAFAMDYALAALAHRRFPWAYVEERR